MSPTVLFGLIGALLVCYFLFRGNTPIGKPMRVAPNGTPGESWYIESTPQVDTPHSCSFVEFDGHGDYIDFKQHEHAWQTVKRLAEAQPLILVTYCHGWKNNSQSYDVVKFVDFLGRLAATTKYRVHGVYLGWRGNLYRPYVDTGTAATAYADTKERFGGPVVSTRWSRRHAWASRVQENFSYWSRRRAAEFKVSGVPMARTIYTCASLVKSIDKDKGRAANQSASSRVLVLGHSFGALMLERALNATCLDPLMNQWSWFTRTAEQKLPESAHPDPMPLDFVLFVNSAAPSVYAKAMRDFLAAHQSALVHAGTVAAFAPVFVSITSSADSATRYAHPAANLLCGLYASLRRNYTDLIKMNVPRPVRQSWFYRRTPGHQPLLVDHWLSDSSSKLTPPASHPAVLKENLQSTQPLGFWAHASGPNGAVQRWKLTLQPASADGKWVAKFGPLHPSHCSYWFIRCDKRIIRDHNDIWSDTAMEVYAALYRLVDWSRNPSNPSNQVLRDYWSGK